MMCVKGVMMFLFFCKFGFFCMKYFVIVILIYILSVCGVVEMVVNLQDVLVQVILDFEFDDVFVIEQNEFDVVLLMLIKMNYWGVKEGDLLILMWEDFMFEGSEEDFMCEY